MGLIPLKYQSTIIDNFGQLVLLFDINLKQHFIHIITAYTSQIIGFRHFKVIIFSDITDDVSDDVNSDLFGTEGYAVVTKGSVCFLTKVTIFLKSGWNLDGNATMRKSGW